MLIIYKKIRHGYVRIGKDGKMKLTIPSILRNNENFKHKLIAKGQQLLKKQKTKIRIKSVEDDFLTIFGERVEKSEIKLVSTKIKDINSKLKEILIEYSIPILQKYSKKIGKPYNKLTVKKLKSKRGSCDGHQNICLNLNLVHLPTKFVRYVIIHEACHLKEKNHGQKFRDLIKFFSPDYKITKKEMKQIIID